MPEERIVGGLRCSDVLARLSDYVDGELPRVEIQRIEEHLRGCDWCERFGGEFAAAVAALRRSLAHDEPMADAIRARLRDRLRRE